MRKLLLTFLMLLFVCSSASAQHGIQNFNVLIVHSYHKEMQWVEEVHRGIEQELMQSLGSSLDLKVEYMDSKRYVDDTYYSLLEATWRHKYRNVRLDCIIVCDDNALNLVLQLRDNLFNSIPIVFCGVNLYEPQRFATLDNITGVVEAYDLHGTLDIVQSLQPGATKIYIVNDETTTGRANRSRLEAIYPEFSDQFTFEFSGSLPLSQLQNKLRNLSTDTVVLLMSYNRDADGQILRYRDSMHLVRESTTRPVFGVWSFFLGKGIVGGSLVSGESQGKTAAELALLILHGQDASSLPVITESPNHPMFDFNELQRFAIPRSVLPPESIIINIPVTIWNKYKTVILTAIFLFICQSLIIALLIRNIRQRKESEEKLLKNRQNLAVTLEAIGDAVVSVDNKHTIIRANSAASNLFATPVENLRGKNLPDFLTQLDPILGSELSDLIRLSCDTGQSIGIPVGAVLTLENNSGKHVSGNCSPIRDASGSIQGAVLILHDITETQTMQAMLAQSRKMEAIGQLAGGVAHDFNNLLTGISGFAELLSIQLEDDTPKRETARKIIDAAARAADLTRKLLSFARKGKIVSSPVDCHEALRSAIGLLERSLDKSIELQLQLHAEHSVILGDRMQLENVFLNLGINGADAMSDGGILTFTTADLRLDRELSCDFGEFLKPGNYLQITVSDTGCGIDESVRQQIFEPFYTTKEKGKGTGLGLPAVLGAINDHGGRIRLVSEPDRGTAFNLYFPIQPQHQPVKTEVQLPSESGNATVLVIDDESIILASAKGLLNELGYKVIVANDPGTGIEIYSRKYDEIDIIILDMIMPEMNGTACFKELKNINPDVRVLISSGFAKSSHFKEVEKLGALGFLQKPYSATEVSKAIRSVLHSRQT
jgi:PAS domain S-box-containing protein